MSEQAKEKILQISTHQIAIEQDVIHGSLAESVDTSTNRAKLNCILSVLPENKCDKLT